MTNKTLGRIADSPVIGGHLCLMEFKDLSLEQAAREVIKQTNKKGGR